MLAEKKKRLRHFLQVMNLRPACIARSLGLQLLLHINQQAYPGFLPVLLRPFCEDTACRIFKEFPDGLLLIILRKGREPDETFLRFSPDGDVLAALDLIAGFL